MALEAVVFPQDLVSCSLKDFCGFDLTGFLIDDCEEVKGAENLTTTLATENQNETSEKEGSKKRRLTRRKRNCNKNKEEVENQRMTHIAVERNRRRLMNEYLTVLRSLMPPAYVQKGDQASIVGGAINFVKELEQLLQSLEAQKRIKLRSDLAEGGSNSSPFTQFFTFPQYSSTSQTTINAIANNTNIAIEAATKNHSSVVNIEVRMAESHANVKVLLRRQPKQLLKMVLGLQDLRFTILHINVTTTDQMVLYSFSLKVEEDCKFRSMDDITTAVNQIVGKIEESSGFNC